MMFRELNEPGELVRRMEVEIPHADFTETALWLIHNYGVRDVGGYDNVMHLRALSETYEGEWTDLDALRREAADVLCAV